jgi:hypothetical protein
MIGMITFVTRPIAKSQHSKALEAFLAGSLSRYFFKGLTCYDILNI